MANGRMPRQVSITIAGVLLAGLVPAGPALADFCIGLNCGAASGPDWHLHCTTPGGQECWDASDDTCDLTGQCGEGGVFSTGTIGAANAEVAAIQVANEVFTEFVVPTTPPAVAQQLAEARDESAESQAEPRGGVSEVSGVLQYQFYEMTKVETVLYGGKLGYEYDSDAVAVGLRVPFQYIDYADFDFTGWRVGTEAYLKGHIVNEPGVAWHLGGAALFNGVKFENFDFMYYYGGGPFTALDLQLGIVGMSVGFAGTYSKPKDGDGFVTLVGGGSAGVPLGSLLSVSAHGYYTELRTDDFDEIELGAPPDTSNSYITVGGEVGMVIVRGWTLSGGYNYRFGFGDYTANEVYLGTAAKF